MEAVIGPLVRDIDAGLRKPMTGGPDDALQILQIHHLIMSIGSIAKGFPDAPEILPTQPPQWIAAFEQASDGIFRALDVMKSQRIVRDAVRAKRFVRFRHITPFALTPALFRHVSSGTQRVLRHLRGTVHPYEPIHS